MKTIITIALIAVFALPANAQVNDMIGNPVPERATLVHEMIGNPTPDQIDPSDVDNLAPETRRRSSGGSRSNEKALLLQIIELLNQYLALLSR